MLFHSRQKQRFILSPKPSEKMLGPATTLSRYSGWTTKMTALLHLQWCRSRMPGDLPPFPILHSIRTTSLYNGSKINKDTTDWTHRSEMKWKTYLKTIIWMWLSVVTTGIKVSVFWDLKPCSLVFARVCQHLEAIYSFRLQGTLGTFTLVIQYTFFANFFYVLWAFQN